ncbi:tetratricopeptide repeat protein [Desulfonatronospira sp.]|uniref:tetratricopeptide repeat protein n=1 Tax=Desulfonatronospira sp. TaxID=1962951 RepID=UPI0025B9131F|nr:tetratricopeptide repeat protein [Desulfonatronospira sp.]
MEDSKKKLTIYEKIVKFFLNEGKGCIIAITQDSLLIKAIKAMYKAMGKDPGSFYHKQSLEKAASDTKSLLARFNQVVFLVEASIDGVSNILHIKNLKNTLGYKCKIVVMTSETERSNIIQMYEMGADNVIVKPVSVNSLLQKIALTINPNNELIKKVDEAKSMLVDNHLDQAEKVAQEILTQKPDSAIAYILKGDIAKKRNQFDLAEKFYLKAAGTSKMYLEPLKKLAELYSDINNLEKKLEYLKKMDKLSPLNHERKIELGDTYLRMDNEDQAKVHFNQAVKQVQKQARDIISATYMQIAKKIREERPDLSSQYVAKALEHKGASLSRDDIWMFNEIGISLRQQGKWQESIGYYKQALKIAPMDGGLYYNVGMAYAQGKEYYRALENFQKAMEVTPELLSQYSSIPFNIAKVYLALQKPDDALKYLKKALEVNPEYQSAKKLMAKITS